ncbi:MAG: YitT family protein [Clostridium sp.]|nr:YitT family protein [Prevotella sp.]MCM1429381.1 YitT family protein [Clostridium sp.]MCM1475584.1 YitT family protein [Muribaculaceae bacterium]
MKKHKYDSLMHNARDYVMIIVGLIFYAIGFTIFILPHNIVIGGMAGLGTLVYFATNRLIPVAVTMYGVNLILILFGWRMLGRAFTMRTIFGATGISILIGLIEGYFTSHPPLLPDTPMSIILGGILCGIGIGTIYIHNGTSGGTDIVAAMITKVSNVSVGRIMMAVDMSIVAGIFFTPFDGTLEERFQVMVPKIIYGLVIIFIYSNITDMLINTNRQATQFMIFSTKWREIADKINTQAHRGVTVLDGEGWYTKHQVKILMVWCRKIESVTIFRIIKSIDPDAFVSQGNVNGVYGRGFDKVKIKMEKKSHGKEETMIVDNPQENPTDETVVKS